MSFSFVVWSSVAFWVLCFYSCSRWLGRERMTPVSTYKQMLLMILDEKMSGEAQHLHIQDLEDYVIANGLDLPIVRLPTHYLRGVKWFTNRGNVALCNCGAIWPCSQAKEINHVQNEAQDT